MKYVTACLLAIVGLSSVSANVAPLGPQAQACPAGTQLYSISGCGYVTREATCYESSPRPDKQQTCGYSACHCIRPTVRNQATGQCVNLDKCPNAKIIHGHGGGGRPKIERRPVPQNGANIPVPVRRTVPAPAPVPYVPAPVVTTPVVPAPVLPAPVASTPVIQKPVYNAGYTNYNSGYNNENTGYTNSNTGYARNNNGNTGYSNYNTGYRNSNNGYNNYNSGYNNNALPLKY